MKKRKNRSWQTDYEYKASLYSLRNGCRVKAPKARAGGSSLGEVLANIQAAGRRTAGTVVTIRRRAVA